MYIRKRDCQDFPLSESFLFSVNLLLETDMSKEIRKIVQSEDPESYDLLSGTPNIERIFCHYCNAAEKCIFPVFTQRVNEVIRRGNYWSLTEPVNLYWPPSVDQLATQGPWQKPCWSARKGVWGGGS